MRSIQQVPAELYPHFDKDDRYPVEGYDNPLGRSEAASSHFLTDHPPDVDGFLTDYQWSDSLRLENVPPWINSPPERQPALEAPASAAKPARNASAGSLAVRRESSKRDPRRRYPSAPPKMRDASTPGMKNPSPSVQDVSPPGKKGTNFPQTFVDAGMPVPYYAAGVFADPFYSAVPRSDTDGEAQHPDAKSCQFKSAFKWSTNKVTVTNRQPSSLLLAWLKSQGAIGKQFEAESNVGDGKRGYTSTFEWSPTRDKLVSWHPSSNGYGAESDPESMSRVRATSAREASPAGGIDIYHEQRALSHDRRGRTRDR